MTTSTSRHRGARPALGALVAGGMALAGPLAGWSAVARAQPPDLSDGDRRFLVDKARGASYEFQFARWAFHTAARRDVRDHAGKLVQDHERYDAALEKLGRARGPTLPTDLDAADKTHMRDLERSSGKAFDDPYVKEALRIDAEDKRDGAEEKASTKDRGLGDVLAAFDDMDQEHDKLAQKLEEAKD